MPTIPFVPLALLYMFGMFIPIAMAYKVKRANWNEVMRQQILWACYCTPVGLYVAFWNSVAIADWIGGAITLPFLLLGTYMSSLMLRFQRSLRA